MSLDRSASAACADCACAARGTWPIAETEHCMWRPDGSVVGSVGRAVGDNFLEFFPSQHEDGAAQNEYTASFEQVP